MKSILRSYKDDFFKLFVRREWRVLLGRNLSNLWLLVAMLSATFLAIAFSNASMNYLSDKMNDPFIKWVDIKNTFGEGDFSGLELALNDEEKMQRFNYNGYQSDYYFSFMFFGAETNMLQYYQCRFFQDIKTELVEAVLSDDNVIGNYRVSDLYSVSDETIGIIITQNALKRLGYEEPPAYLDLCHYNAGADSLGFELYANQFARIPIPVLAVVKRLPSNVDIISTKFFYEQENNDNTYPFNITCNPEYTNSLRYFVPSAIDDKSFKAELIALAETITSVDVQIDDYAFYKPSIVPFMEGAFVSLIGENEQAIPSNETIQIDREMMSRWQDKGVCRVYDYNFSPYELIEKSYLSVYFNKLNHIKEFESFVDEYKVKIDMSQINSKENYNAVSIMANVLSWAIIVFAIICIILFIVDLLKSYFQKVKRNIGTFKAFGVSNDRLTSIYVLIIGATIILAIIISLCLVLVLQESLIIANVLKEDNYSYLSLLNANTLITVFIISTVSIVTIRRVIHNMLKQTPGDLIYDR